MKIQNHLVCEATGKLVVTKNNPYWCDEGGGHIYPWHLNNPGEGCKLISQDDHCEMLKRFKQCEA